MPDRRTKTTALVTGANRGIGFAIARRLAELGVSVLAGVRDEAKADVARAEFRKLVGDITPVVLDVTDTARMPAVLAEIEKHHASIDILINNAAILIDGPGGFDASLLDMTDETLRKTWETNVLAPAALTRALLPGMIARRYGRIVNMSSQAGQLAGMGAGFPAYRMSKTALNALTRISAAEAESTNADIKVNACSPGWVRTGMGGPEAPRTPEQGAETAVWLAMLPANGPTGGFYQDKTAIAW